MKHALWFALTLCLLVGSSRGQGLQQFEEEFIKITGKVRPSVVQVTGTMEGNSLAWSGVVLDEKGHIVTAGNMIAHLRQYSVKFHGGHVATARLVGYDPLTTLGVLKVPAGAHLKPAPVASAESVRVGSIAIVVGNPFGFDGSISTGIISGKDRTIQTGNTLLSGMVQTTAPINPGDSGGLLANSRGQMVGIVTSTFGRGTIESVSRQMQKLLRDPDFQKQMSAWMEYVRRQDEFKKHPEKLMEFLARTMKELKKSGINPFGGSGRKRQYGYGLSAQGINFVLPADQVQRITREIISTGRVARGYLGVSVSEKRINRQQSRLLIDMVAPDGPAARAGVTEGDVLVGFGGQAVPNMYALSRMVRFTRPGQVVELLLLRGDKQMTVRVKLGRK